MALTVFATVGYVIGSYGAELQLAGVSQFVDIGSGLPTVSITHEVVRTVIPDARVC